VYLTMLVASALIFAGAVVFYLRHPAASVFHPATLYLTFHGLVFVIRPWFAWYFNYKNMYVAIGFTPSLWDKTNVLICTNLALIVFLTVVLRVAREPLKFKHDAADVQERSVLLTSFWPIALVLGGFGVYSLWWIWGFRASGEAIMEMDTYTGATRLSASNGYFLGLSATLGAISVMIAYLGKFRPWALLPFAGFMVLKFGTGSRGDVVAVALAIGMLYLFSRKKKWPSLLLLLPAIPLILVFNSLQQDRGAYLREAFGADIRNDIYIRSEAVERKPLETMDLANMEFFEFLVGVVPEQTGTYDYFLANLQLVTAPIPRALWKDKPVGAPIKMFELYRYGTPLGITFAVPGMGWYYMGYVGIVIWSAFFACLYGYPYRLLTRGRESNLAVMAYFLFLSTGIIGFRDGVIYSVLAQCLFKMPPLIILALMARLKVFPGAEDIRGRWFGSASAVPVLEPAAASNPRARRMAAAHAQTAAPPLDVASLPRPSEEMTPRQRRLARMKGT